MLKPVFQNLDLWVQSENEERRKDGRLTLPKAQIKVLGQTALLEAQLKLEIAATQDVDVYADLDYAVRKQLEQQLAQYGKFLDPDSDLIWMPRETEYVPFFLGQYIEASLAKPEYILISKALKAPEKNLPLIRGYLAAGASDLFLDLAEKHHVDLERFL